MAPRDRIPGSALVVAAPSVLSTELASEIVMLDLDAGIYYGLDGVGAEIWRRLGAGDTVDAVVAAIVEMYDVDEARCRRDVDALIADLLKRNLVQLRTDGA